jgi:3-keto-5-aminohexanoate cleavage enzyme
MGGRVRVGLEDALYYDWTAKQPATNARLIERIVVLARAAGREMATAEEARRIIGMRSPGATLRMAA